jgi:putative transposase
MLSYKFRLYQGLRADSNRQLALCRCLYNRLLSELNLVHEKRIKLRQTDTSL